MLDLPDIFAYCLTGRATYLELLLMILFGRYSLPVLGYIPRNGLPVYPQVMNYLKWLSKCADTFGPVQDYLAVRSIANVCYASEVLKARDTIAVWEELIHEFEIEEEDTADDIIEKSKGFKKWCEEHPAELKKSQLGNGA